MSCLVWNALAREVSPPSYHTVCVEGESEGGEREGGERKGGEREGGEREGGEREGGEREGEEKGERM